MNNLYDEITRVLHAKERTGIEDKEFFVDIAHRIMADVGLGLPQFDVVMKMEDINRKSTLVVSLGIEGLWWKGTAQHSPTHRSIFEVNREYVSDALSRIVVNRLSLEGIEGSGELVGHDHYKAFVKGMRNSILSPGILARNDDLYRQKGTVT